MCLCVPFGMYFVMLHGLLLFAWLCVSFNVFVCVSVDYCVMLYDLFRVIGVCLCVRYFMCLWVLFVIYCVGVCVCVCAVVCLYVLFPVD